MMVGAKAISAKELKPTQRVIIIIHDHHLYKYFAIYKCFVFILSQQTVL